MRIVFLHPDMGIGGAERLVLDAALALKRRGHDVGIYTNHYDPAHRFEDAASVDVTAIGSWIPRSVFGRCRAACAYLRFVYLALHLTLFVFPNARPDVVFCDLISLCIPALRLAPNPPGIVFYCHHPDKLLSPPGGRLKRLYRRPLDWLEEKTTARADLVLVNSEYTSKVYSESFPSIAAAPEVCYPSVDTRFFDRTAPGPIGPLTGFADGDVVLLSINRFERKKNLGLALRTLAALRKTHPRVRLVLAGGHDPINQENVRHHEELVRLAAELRIGDAVKFLKSPSDADKVSLLHGCDVVVYTPSNEHFGIVPLEAMYYAKPVVAVNSGGPTETVVNNVTGFLCDPDEGDFAEHVGRIVSNPEVGRMMGEAGRQRFEARFSYDAFAEQLDTIVKTKLKTRSKKNN